MPIRSPRKQNRVGIEWETSAAFYSVGVNMLGETLQTVRENTEVFIEACKDIGLEVNAK